MPLLYDFNNDGVVNGADVVYFASHVAGLPDYNISNINSATTGKLLNYTYLNPSSLLDFVVDFSSQLVSDFSLNITPLYTSSKIQFNMSLNYLTSCFPNTFLKLDYFYNINSGNDISFGKSILGTENTSFMRNSLNLNIITDPMIDLSGNNGSYVINFNIKASIYSATGTNSFSIGSYLPDDNKPKLLFNQIGNSIILTELEG